MADPLWHPTPRCSTLPYRHPSVPASAGARRTRGARHPDFRPRPGRGARRAAGRARRALDQLRRRSARRPLLGEHDQRARLRQRLRAHRPGLHPRVRRAPADQLRALRDLRDRGVRDLPDVHQPRLRARRDPEPADRGDHPRPDPRRARGDGGVRPRRRRPGTGGLPTTATAQRAAPRVPHHRDRRLVRHPAGHPHLAGVEPRGHDPAAAAPAGLHDLRRADHEPADRHHPGVARDVRRRRPVREPQPPRTRHPRRRAGPGDGDADGRQPRAGHHDHVRRRRASSPASRRCSTS